MPIRYLTAEELMSVVPPEELEGSMSDGAMEAWVDEQIRAGNEAALVERAVNLILAGCSCGRGCRCRKCGQGCVSACLNTLARQQHQQLGQDT